MSRINQVAVTGSSGLIGSALVGQLRADGYEVKKIVRRPTRNNDEITWNPTLGQIDLTALADVDAIVHLAGVGVGDNLAADIPTIKLRTGLVLDPTGGALGRMLPLFKFGLGGKLGNGKQWWSWITLHDQIRAMIFLLNSKITGPVNLTSPNPVTNQEFTAALARALHRPAIFPAPAFALRAALGGFSSEILGSKKVMPKVLTESGFEFDYPHVSNALIALVD